MVFVRFAYGFLDRLVHMCPPQTMPLHSTGITPFHHYYGLLPHGFAGHFLPARLGRYPTYIPNVESGMCRPWFPCSLHPSFT